MSLFEEYQQFKNQGNHSMSLFDSYQKFKKENPVSLPPPESKLESSPSNEIGIGEYFSRFSDPAHYVPVIGGLLASSTDIKNKMDYLKNGIPKYTAPPAPVYGQPSNPERLPLTEDEKKQYTKNIENYFSKAAELQERGLSIPAQITSTIAEMIPYMAEFITTSPLRSLLSKAGSKAVEYWIGKNVVSKLAGAVTGTVGTMAGTGSRAVSEKAQRELEGVDSATAAWRAFLGNYIDNLSEVSGGAITKGGGWVLRKLGAGKVIDTLARLSGKSSKEVSDLLAKSEYHGILGEIGEERLADFLKGMTGVETWSDAIPSLTQMLIVEPVAFSVPGLAGKAFDKINRSAKPSISPEDALRQKGQEFSEDLMKNVQEKSPTQEAPPPEKVKPIPVTDADVEKWVAENPAAAAAELATDPSRRDMMRMGLEGGTQPDRTDFYNKVREIRAKEKPVNTEYSVYKLTFKNKNRSLNISQSLGNGLYFGKDKQDIIDNYAIEQIGTEEVSKLNPDEYEIKEYKVHPVKPYILNSEKSLDNLISSVYPSKVEGELSLYESSPYLLTTRMENPEISNWLKKNGYDSLIVEISDLPPNWKSYLGVDQIVVFDKSIIKEEPANVPEKEGEVKQPEIETSAIKQKIFSAYKKILRSRGERFLDPIPIADLREALPDIQHEELSKILEEMHMGQEAQIYAYEDPHELTQRNLAAMVKMKNGREGLFVRFNELSNVMKEEGKVKPEKAESSPSSPPSSEFQEDTTAAKTPREIPEEIQALIDRITMGQEGIDEARKLINGQTKGGKKLLKEQLREQSQIDNIDYIGMVGKDVFASEQKTFEQIARERMDARRKARETSAAKILKKSPRKPIDSDLPTEEKTDQLFDQMAQERDAAPDMNAGVGIVAPQQPPSLKRNPSRTGTLNVPGQPQSSPVIKGTQNVPAIPVPEIEARYTAPPKKQSIASRLADMGLSAWHRMSRSEEHIPNTEEFATAHEWFRLFKVNREKSQDEANRRVAILTDTLGHDGFKLYERYLQFKNIQEAISRGESYRFGMEKIDPKIINDYVQTLEDYVNANPDVRKAIDDRQAAVKTMTDEMKKYGLLPKNVDRDWYYHQMVMERQLLNYSPTTGGAKPKIMKRSSQKARSKGELTGEEFDWNTDYVQAETAWLTEALLGINIKKDLLRLDRRYGKIKEAKVDAKAKGLKNWEDILRDPKWQNHVLWSPGPNNVFYHAFAISEKLAEQLSKKILTDAKITSEDIHHVLAVGTGVEYLLPKEIVAQLETMEKSPLSGSIAELHRSMVRGWKIWTLLNPKRAPGYMLRNITGDIDPIIGGAPGILAPKYMEKVGKDFWNYYAKQNLALSPEMRQARDLGVLNATMATEELRDTRTLSAFKRFYKEKDPRSAFQKYFDAVKVTNEARENFLRYASYLYYLDKVKSGTLNHYGGASKRTVDVLMKEMGPEVAAAHLARNLLGDYGNLTVFGNWLRMNAYPFWSWNEVNLTRYPHLIANAFKWGQATGNRFAGGALGMTAGSILGIGAALHLGTLYASMWAWNNLMHRDEEKDLSTNERSQPHIILGRLDDGSISLLRNTGALGDMFGNFGINEAASLWKDYQAGQVSGGQVFGESAKSILNQLVQGLRPDIKAAFEVAAGKSLFPDVLVPRSQDRDEIVANIFGLSDEWREAKGMLFRNGQRARPNYWQRIIGVSDPRPNALYEIHELRDRFLKKEGEASYPPSKIKVMRDAVQADDYQAFQDARTRYIEGGNSFVNFNRSLNYLDPLANRLSDEKEQEFEHDFLTDVQREKLKIARSYAQDTRIKLWRWWQDAAKNDPPELRQKMMKESQDAIGAMLLQATDPVNFNEKDFRYDLKAEGVTAESDVRKRIAAEKERLAQKREEKPEAIIQELRSMGITNAKEMEKIMREKYASQIKRDPSRAYTASFNKRVYRLRELLKKNP